jgi:putative ABC transport system permease protein
METFWQDLRFALRGLARQPGFAAIAVVTLALGVGVNSAIFTVVNAVVLRQLPFPEPDRLVRVTADAKGLGVSDLGMSPPELFDYRDRAGLFENIAGIYPIDANLTEVDQPERVEVLLVSPSYFEVLGARAAIGRVFGAEDTHPGIAEVAVISDALWRRRFGAVPDIIGRKLRIDGDWFAVVGVMPPEFRHPGRSLRTEVEIWAPAGFTAAQFGPPVRGAYFLAGAIARLKPGVTPSAAQARVDAFGQRLRTEFPNDYTARANWVPRVVPLQQDVVGQTGTVLLVLLGAVCLVLLIACTNVAGLLLARTSARQRELAVRRALGSGRGRLARLLLTESVVLAIAGGLAGLAVGAAALRVLLTMVPDRLPRMSEIAIDGTAVWFTFAIALATGVLFGIAPALQFSDPDVMAQLKDGRASSSRSRQRLRAALVAGEFALAMVLLVAAALLVRSFWNVQRVALGFEPRGVLSARVWLPQPNDPSQGRYFTHPARLAVFERMLNEVRAVPGVDAAAAIQSIPLDGTRGSATITIEGQPPDPAAIPAVQANIASADYFALMGIHLLAGRTFTGADSPQAQPVIVINREMARRYFSSMDPIGKRVHFGGAASKNPWMTIVGVVDNVLPSSPDVPVQPQMTRPLTQASSLTMGLVVHVNGDAAAIKDQLARAVRKADSDLPVYAVRTMSEIETAVTAARRFSMRMLGVFALLALLLAAVGIYGVMAYLVSQRRREIGIRIALGARPVAVLAMIVRQAVTLAAVGTACGIGAALLLTDLIGGMLFDVSPSDPIVFAAIAVALIATALVAAATPARRAAKVDPLIALRGE